ncbi:MAG: hypothetical protein M0011_03665 [Elusimicrobia bacterium]|nr:hypothetical protein [Elusimicrobiota bacterium]
MKKCPSCGYVNRGPGDKCAICGRDLAAVACTAEPEPRRRRAVPDLAPGLILLACGAFVLYRGLHHSAAKPALPEPRKETVFSAYGGAVYSLDKMSAQRFLPVSDKMDALRLLSSEKEKVAYAAAKAAGSWLRAEKDPVASREIFDRLLAASASAVPAARSQAAIEAGMAVLLGFDAGPLEGRIRDISAGLAAEKAPELRGAGFLLSSMAGLKDLQPKMREALDLGPGKEDRLYAACALSRLGDRKGFVYLSRLASAGGGLAAEAVSCLGYSSLPEAGPELKAALRGPQAENAREALLLRDLIRRP